MKLPKDTKEKKIKPFCDCHKADSNFDGNCHYSEYYDNCEHCWTTTQELHTKLLEALEDQICCGGDFCAGAIVHNKRVIEIINSALSQMEDATQEIKKGETKRIAYQKGYKEVEKQTSMDIVRFLDELEMKQPEDLKTDNWRNWKYIRNSIVDKYDILESLRFKSFFDLPEEEKREMISKAAQDSNEAQRKLVKDFDDMKQFKHGDEGTHYACSEMVDKFGGKVGCCGCNHHECKHLQKHLKNAKIKTSG